MVAATVALAMASWDAGRPWPDGIGEALRARIALVAGRLDDAVAHAQAVSRAAGTNGAAGHAR
jgi:hypothetical protein